MEVRFREVDPFNCWIWLRYSDVPSKGEKEYVDGIFDSWYVLGRLGDLILKICKRMKWVLMSVG